MAPSLSCGGRPGHCHRWQESARGGTSGLRVARTASGIGLRRRIWPDAGAIGLPRKVQRNHGHWRVAANAGARGSGCHHRRHGLPERDGRADRGRWWRLRACRQGQPTHLAHALRDFFGTLDAPGYPVRQTCVHETLDKGHGRIETRRCTAAGDLDWLATLGLKERWKKITSVAGIDSSRVIGSKTETDRRYVISSLPADSERILHAVRMHWGIENGLHWCLDVAFGEDACPIRLRNAALDFSLLRRAAMNLFRADHSRAMGLPKKRKAAAWNPDYLANILHLREI
ncbi:transposase, IS4 family [Verminephrobacter eiseniae EF01-2]|uniref:Transposase, IS4 family n=1 Tax=Verminephrobacter eiseniae (strain EF01-2) TaxID=391735 RepID=A1WE63_VEREI|nr:ISAs1 family transposase [Verminephrobacter eiseniae]ABM55920.1 transposase, IS4 family [Verminephrobacter eiseniae EF01-2]